MYLRHYALSRTAIATGSGSLRAHTQCTRLSCLPLQRTAHHLKRDPYHNAATGPYVQHEPPICVAHAYLHPGRLRRRGGGHRHRARVSRRRRRATPSLAPFAVNAPRRVRAAGGGDGGANYSATTGRIDLVQSRLHAARRPLCNARCTEGVGCVVQTEKPPPCRRPNL